MILILIYWILVSLICFIWGRAVVKFFRVGTESGFPVFALTGFASVSVIGGYVSLVAPVGLPWGLFTLLGLTILLAFWIRGDIAGFSKLQMLPVSTILFFVLVIMILVMSSWQIVHPDSLGYHIQAVKWIGEYGNVPGIIHVNPRLGLQSSLFISQAIFSVKLGEHEFFHFTNGLLAAWFCFFAVKNFDNHVKQRNDFLALGWLLLLVICVSGFTLIRLTATSLSPDFAAAMFCWAAFYFFLRDEQFGNKVFFTFLFASFAFSIKISVAPIMLIPAYILLRLLWKREWARMLVCCILLILVFLPLPLRNHFASGYPFYPSTFISSKADWQYEEAKADEVRDYIRGYARGYHSGITTEVTEGANKPFGDWLVTWWLKLSLSDKIIIGLMIASLFISIFLAANSRPVNGPGLLILLTSMAGIIFWFLLAPDPRFGFAFIIPFVGIVFYQLASHVNLPFARWIVVATSLAMIIGMSIYIIYRLNRFFSIEQAWKPAPTQLPSYHKIKYKGIYYYYPLDHAPCSGLPLPCIAGDNADPVMRDSTIRSGFRSN